MNIFSSSSPIIKNALEILNTDWAGWAILVFTYILTYYWRDIRKNKLFMVIFLMLTLHHSIAFVNAYITTTYGAANDAAMFHHTAIQIVNQEATGHFGSGAHFYRLMLAFFYKLFGISLFLGEELSILAFLFSCFIFIKLYKLLGYTKYLVGLLILYGFLPSTIFLGSITLRESWQILFFMLTIYFCLRSLLSVSLGNLVGYIFFASILALFHEGFVIFFFLLAAFMIVFQLIKISHSKNWQLYRRQIALIVFTLAAAIIMGLSLRVTMDMTPELKSFHSLSEGKALEFIEEYRTKGMQLHGRASYKTTIDDSSLINLAITFGSTFLYYMFAPFPWQISNILDLYAAFEATLRLALLLIAIITCYKTRDDPLKLSIFLLLIYFMISMLWSLGTMNYGTCVRHHMVGYWILLLILGAYFHIDAKHMNTKLA